MISLLSSGARPPPRSSPAALGPRLIPEYPLLLDVPFILIPLMSWSRKPFLLDVLTVLYRLNVLNALSCLMSMLSTAAWRPSCHLLFGVPFVLLPLMS